MQPEHASIPASPAAENAEQRALIGLARVKHRAFHIKVGIVGFALALVAAGLWHGSDRGSPCPDGAEYVGEAPPAGTRAYCRILDGEREVLHGVYREWYADRGTWIEGHRVPTRRLEGEYTKGVKSGQWYRWRHNATLRDVVGYRGEVEHGPFAIYDKEGRLSSRGENANGVKHGPFVSFFPDGSKKMAGNFYEGQRDGVWKHFWGNGSERRSEGYRRGVAHGEVAHNFATGEPEVRGHYVDGLQDGTWTRWHKPGVHAGEQRYARGLPHGVWRTFSEQGELLREELWQDGSLQGPVREWYEGGGEKLIGQYDTGFPVGVWVRLNESGVELSRVDHGAAPIDDDEPGERQARGPG